MKKEKLNTRFSSVLEEVKEAILNDLKELGKGYGKMEAVIV